MAIQLELLEHPSLTAALTLENVAAGTVVRDLEAKDKRLIMKVAATGFLLNSSVVADVINRHDCLVVNLETGRVYATKGTRRVLAMDCKLQYFPTPVKVSIRKES